MHLRHDTIATTSDMRLGSSDADAPVKCQAMQQLVPRLQYFLSLR